MALNNFDPFKGFEEILVLQIRGIEAADQRDGSAARDEQRSRIELLQFSVQKYLKLCKQYGHTPNNPTFSRPLEHPR